MTYYSYLLYISHAAHFVRDKSIILIVRLRELLMYINTFVLFAPYPPHLILVFPETKASILKQNKGKSGIYKWTHIESGKCYVGSAVDLSKRFKNYFNVYYLKREITVSRSLIYGALLKYGYTSFTS